MILTQYWAPETGAPQNRLGDLAARLVTLGHEVAVVTAMPNYPSGRVAQEWRGRLIGRERQGGVDVLRSWISTSPGRSVARQLLTYFSFAATAAVTAPFRLGRADVLMWESPPLFLAPTAWLLKRRLGSKLVMNVSDLWPESAVSLGMVRDRRIVSLLEGLERWAYRSADLVSHQTQGIGAGISSAAPGAPLLFFPNGVDTAALAPVDPPPGLRAALGLPATGSVVGYAGNFGRAQALEQVVRAAALLQADGVPATFLLLGDGPRKQDVMACAEELRVENVVFAPSVPASQMAAVLSLVDVALVPLAAAPVFEGARPSKMFELLSVGVPFVYCGRGEGARLAEESGAGVVVAPEDHLALAAALRRLLAIDPEERRRMGRTSRRFVVDRFDRASIALAFEAGLLALVG